MLYLGCKWQRAVSSQFIKLFDFSSFLVISFDSCWKNIISSNIQSFLITSNFSFGNISGKGEWGQMKRISQQSVEEE